MKRRIGVADFAICGVEPLVRPMVVISSLTLFLLLDGVWERALSVL